MKLSDLELDLNASHNLIEVLRFYGDPTTYWAVALISDSPAGPIMSDFGETDLGQKPGVRARKMLRELNDLSNTDMKLREENTMRTDIDGSMTEVAPETAREIPEQLAILRNQIASAQDMLDSLEDKLSPVLGPLPDTKPQVKDSDLTTELAQSIRDARLGVERIFRQLRLIYERAEL